LKVPCLLQAGTIIMIYLIVKVTENRLFEKGKCGDKNNPAFTLFILLLFAYKSKLMYVLKHLLPFAGIYKAKQTLMDKLAPSI
jgi:hypothetical protein